MVQLCTAANLSLIPDLDEDHMHCWCSIINRRYDSVRIFECNAPPCGAWNFRTANPSRIAFGAEEHEVGKVYDEHQAVREFLHWRYHAVLRDIQHAEWRFLYISLDMAQCLRDLLAAFLP